MGRYVLGTGPGIFSSDVAVLDFENPTRRDVAMLPADGWLVLAFEANNPGAWLMHCHIVSFIYQSPTLSFPHLSSHIYPIYRGKLTQPKQAWHVGEGLAVQFIEGERDEILSTLDIRPEWQQTCDNWNEYWENVHYEVYTEEGAGI